MEGVGKLTGDKDLEAEGKADQDEGKIREERGKRGGPSAASLDGPKDKLSGNA